MKICQVTPRYPPHAGGVETHVRQISEHLADCGHEVIVVSADATTDVQSVERRNGVTIRRHQSLSPNSAFHIAPRIARTVQRVEADVIHAHNYHSLPVLFAALGLQNEQFVVTPHYHGGSASLLRDRLLSLYYPFGKWVLRRADAVIAVSEWERERLQADFGTEGVVIPNGIDDDHFGDRDAEDRKRPYLLCVGRLEEYKGIQYAIRALTALPEWELVIAGSGPYRSTLEAIAKRATVADRVSFLGYVDNKRLPRLYAGADVFLALSDFEAYGMTVAESLLSGTPCVIHGAGALKDWRTNSGCVEITTRTPEQIADGVQRALNRSPDTEVLASWEEVTVKILDVYSRC